MSKHSHSSPFPSSLRTNSTTSAANHHSNVAEAAAPPISGNPNLTTCVYHTDLGLFALTWSRTALGRSLHLHLDNPSAAANDNSTPSPSSSSSSGPSFHLHLKPFIFWNKKGSKKLNTTTTAKKTIEIFWDLSRAKFESGPGPQSGYYIAVVIDGVMTLLVGDSPDEAYAKTRSSQPRRAQAMVLRREHVYGINKLYTTKASFGGKTRDISIDCRVGGDDPRLCFNVDRKRVLQVKHLKWKFRGNERIEVDGVYIQVSWDVYNWLFEGDDNGYALFIFKFETLGFEDEDEEEEDEACQLNEKNGMVLWSQDSQQQSCGFGFEKKKMMKRKRLLRTARSSSTSSSSLSSASSGCSSVMEWASVEENELKGPSGFSLLVYAWKR